MNFYLPLFLLILNPLMQLLWEIKKFLIFLYRLIYSTCNISQLNIKYKFKDKHLSVKSIFNFILKFSENISTKMHCNVLCLQSCRFFYDNFRLYVVPCYLIKISWMVRFLDTNRNILLILWDRNINDYEGIVGIIVNHIFA